MRIEVIWCGEETEDAYPEIILSDGSVLTKDDGWGVCDDPAGRELARRLLEERKQQQALDEHNDKLEKEVGSLELHLDQRIADHQDRLDHLESNVHSIAEAIGRLTGDVRNGGDRMGAQAANLSSLAGMVGDLASMHEKLEQDLLLVRGHVAHVDEREAADYLATQARLAALEEWRGAAEDLPAGVDAMRDGSLDYDKLLAVWRLWGPNGELRTKLTGADFSGMHYGYGEYFRQLRSELLALPDEVKP